MTLLFSKIITHLKTPNKKFLLINSIRHEEKFLTKNIRKIYTLKKNLDNEMSFLYTNKLMQYYTNIRSFSSYYQDLNKTLNSENYPNFKQDVCKLEKSYHDLVELIFTIDLIQERPFSKQFPNRFFSFSNMLKKIND